MSGKRITAQQIRFLASFATQAHEVRSLELEVHGTHVEDFLHPCAGIEQGEEQSLVSSALGLEQVHGVQHCADLLAFEVLDGDDASSFGRNREETLAELETLGMACGKKTGEGMDGGESRIARRGRVCTLALQMLQEGQQILGAKMHDIHVDDLAGMSRGEETQQQDEGIAVAKDGFRAEPADERQMLAEERAQGAGEDRRWGKFSPVASWERYGREQGGAVRIEAFAGGLRDGVEEHQ